MSKNTEVAMVEFNAPVVGENIGSLMAEEMEGLQLSFDRIKIPSGGGIAFEVPSDNPDEPDMTKEILGVIVDHHPINAYWQNKYEGQNTPPDCSCLDGKCGTGIPGGSCKICKLNQFGTAEDGKGKVCKNMHRVYLLRSGELFPILLTLPPTSIKSLSDYLKRVITKGLKSCKVITKVTLKKVQNSTGISYSQAQFSMISVLASETSKQMEIYSMNIKPTTRELQIEYELPIEEQVVTEDGNIGVGEMPF